MPGFELIDSKEKNAVISVFENNGGVLFAHGFDNIRNGHYEVRELEKKASEYFNSKYCLAVSSGTASLKIALKCCLINAGDNIISQAHNFISDGEVILDYNCIPKILNIDDSLNLDVNELENNIDERTKAVIISDMLGNGNDIEKIEQICKKKNVLLIDDACEIIGGKFKNKFYGTFGDIGIFSLDFGKNITSGEGGLIFTDNDEYYEIMRQYTDHGHMNNKNFPRGADDFGIPGFNFRMTELQASIAKVQIDKLEGIITENKKRYDILKSNLSNFRHRKIFDNVEPSYDTFIFFVENNILLKLITNHIKKIGFGTKNLPDALRWHCFYYWDHILPNNQKDHLLKSKKILNNSIAIPIFLKKDISFYYNLAKDINKIKNDFEKNNFNLEINYLAIIPARSGSKGIKNKNGLKLKNNKSLIELVTRNVEDSRMIDGIFFTTDDEDYKKLYHKESFSKDVTGDYLRSSKLAEDNSLPSEYICDCIKYLKNKNINVKNIIVCQTTTPLYSYIDLDKAIIKHKENDNKSLITVSKPMQDYGDMIIYNEEKKKYVRSIETINRQNYYPSYWINGIAYISNLDIYIKEKTFFNNFDFYLIKNDESNIDVDTEFDLKLLNFLIK
jgi:8-amino-3,8-dideoxy-alpha-D-manno-octulosonate transaminase